MTGELAPMPFDEAWKYAHRHVDASHDHRDYADATVADMEECERAARTLMRDWLAASEEPFDIAIVQSLADRTRAMNDALIAKGLAPEPPMIIAQHLPYRTVLKGIATLQGRSLKPIEKAVNRGPKEQYRERVRREYFAAPFSGDVTGVDLEATGADPLRCHIINVGWLVMDLARGAEPHDAHSVICGLPAVFRDRDIPFENMHHITWEDVEGRPGFRRNGLLQARLLASLTARPYMAHLASFEHMWFLYNLDGYAQAFKHRRALPVDTREICRKLDTDVDRMPLEAHPATLENWARRRGTLGEGEHEHHRGLDDADLMLRTVLAELERNNLVA